MFPFPGVSSFDPSELNKAVSIAGPSFQRIVDLAMIVQKVNNDKMTKKDALPAVYNIYKRNIIIILFLRKI